MTTLREAAQKALEALEGGADSWQLVGPAIDALKEALVEDAMQKFTDVNQELEAALAEPVQEPVAWRTFDGEGGYDYRTYEDNEDYAAEWAKRNPRHVGWVEPLYAAPHQRPAEPTLSQQLATAGFTRRDTRLECDECGGKFTRQMLPIHKCEPVQEPVAWIGYINGVANDLAFEPFDLDSDVKKPLFTAPPTLTDDQLDDIAVAARTGNLYDLRIAIERAHGII